MRQVGSGNESGRGESRDGDHRIGDSANRFSRPEIVRGENRKMNQCDIVIRPRTIRKEWLDNLKI
jgi:hypothetical protein